MFDTLKLVFDTFGKDLMVPVMIFIICMIFKAPAKKAFSSAGLVGVGLKGMTFITTEFGAVLSPLVQQLIATTGLNLKALDIGWQAVASVAYSTDIGMMFIGVGLLFQIILWLVKWTVSCRQICGITTLSSFGDQCSLQSKRTLRLHLY